MVMPDDWTRAGQHRPEKRGRQPVEEDHRDEEHRSSTESANASEAVRGAETAMPPLHDNPPACAGRYTNTWIGQSPQQTPVITLRPIGNSEAHPMMPPAQYEHLQTPQSSRQIGQQAGSGSSAGRSPIGGTPTSASVAAAAASAAASASALPSAVNGVALPGQVMGSITLPLLNMSPYPVPMMQDIHAANSGSPLRTASPLAAALGRPIGETPGTPGSSGSTGRLSGVSADGVGVAADPHGAAYFGSAPAGAACYAGVSADGVGTTSAAQQPFSDALGGVSAAPVGQLTLADPVFMPAILGSTHARAQALVAQQQGLLVAMSAAAGQLAHVQAAQQQQQQQGPGCGYGQRVGVTASANGASPGGQAAQPSLQQHCQPGGSEGFFRACTMLTCIQASAVDNWPADLAATFV